MVREGKGRLFRRKDGKYLIYVPESLATDSQFPFKTTISTPMRISFKPGEVDKLHVERWIEPPNPQ